MGSLKTKNKSGGLRPRRRNEPAAEPVSLRPLKVEEALGDLLKVKPSKSEIAGRSRSKLRKDALWTSGRG